MKFFFGVGQVDWTQCILKKSLKKQQGIYDGKLHTITLNGSVKMNGSTQEIDYKYRFKFSASQNKLSGFEAWICSGDGKGKYTQEQYQKQSFDDDTFSLDSIVTSENYNVNTSTSLTATLDDKNQFVGLKKISYKEAPYDGSSRFVEADILQSANNIRYVGYENSEGSLTKFYSFAEILDSNSTDEIHSLTNIAYGSGAALVNNGTLFETGWNGNTLAVDNTSAYLTKTSGHSSDLSGSSTAPSIGFNKAQTYDCEGEDSESLDENVDLDDLIECANAYNIDQEGSNMCSSLSYQ